jgi:hypothetical protein
MTTGGGRASSPQCRAVGIGSCRRSLPVGRLPECPEASGRQTVGPAHVPQDVLHLPWTASARPVLSKLGDESGTKDGMETWVMVGAARHEAVLDDGT